MKAALAIIFCLLAGAPAAQDVPVTTEQQLENNSDESPEDDAYLQQLAFWQKNPLNLNTATAEELSLLRFLTAWQLQQFFSYRAAFGRLLHIYELQAIPGFDLLTIQKILPYVYSGEPQTAKERMAFRFRNSTGSVFVRVSRILQKARGYNRQWPISYAGDPNHVQARVSFQYKNLLYYGAVADKDAGEPLFRGAQKLGFDFYAAHFFIRDLGRVKALALGDYTVNLGQGLVHWQSMAFGKSAEVLLIKRQSPVLLPYRSAGEFNFNRGAAATWQFGALQATGFISHKRFSANVVNDSVPHFTSFNTSGYHRTENERRDRNRVGHFSAGGSIMWLKGSGKVGLNAVWHRFSLPLQKKKEPYNQFALSGTNHLLGSIDYSYTLYNMHLFGEVAFDSRFHKAMVHGALLSVDPKVDLSILYRHLSKAFQSPFGNAFTENTLPGNETGIFTGVQLRPHPAWRLAAFVDFYRFSFLKYRVSSPGRGSDYLVQLTFMPEKRTEIHLRYRSERKPGDVGSQVINYPIHQPKQNIRLHFITPVTGQITVKARAEVLWLQKLDGHVEEGFLGYVEAACTPVLNIKGNFRLQYFETKSYDSRIYAYESDVQYSFSAPAFWDKGYRWYGNLEYSATKKLSVWLRIAKTVYAEKTFIGSGLDEISGRHKTDVKMQVRYLF